MPTTQEDYRKQLAFLLAVRDKLSEANGAINRIRNVQQQVQTALQRAKADASAADAAHKLDDQLGDDVSDMPKNWNRRFKDNLERIKTGSLYEVATVLRKLVLLQKERNLSFGEKKMLETVRELLVSEISHAVGIDEGDARSMVDRTIAKA